MFSEPPSVDEKIKQLKIHKSFRMNYDDYESWKIIDAKINRNKQLD